MLRIGKFDPSFEANYSIMDLTNLSDMHYIGCLPHNRIHRKTMQRSFQVKRKIKLNKQISIHQSNNMVFFELAAPLHGKAELLVSTQKSVISEPLMIALSLLIDQGFGIYIHQEVCTEVPWDFFFIWPILLQRTFFYREMYSVNFGPISNVRRYPCTTKALSFFFLYCGKIFWLPKVCM